MNVNNIADKLHLIRISEKYVTDRERYSAIERLFQKEIKKAHLQGEIDGLESAEGIEEVSLSHKIKEVKRHLETLENELIS